MELDLWGANLVLYEMVEQVLAFRSLGDITDATPMFYKQTSLKYKTFIDQALHKDRDERVGEWTVWTHEWMRSPY